MQSIQKGEILFETKDVFAKIVRTTISYWDKIFLIKHKELKISKESVIKTISKPTEVRRSIQDPYIYLFYKKIKRDHLVVVVKYMNDHGFIVTIYQTSKVKRKGEKIWRK